ncbi:MAG: 4-hydroxy-2-oxo-heptane-1,7-dioate aldolase [Rhodobacteraceae bacterium]|nr:4-hydroxy-2-oxo-heptane-1,7-dioate aldolase [Paracoccaceae bacterium]
MELPVNRFKAGLKAGKVQYGLWITIPDPSLAESMAGAGFDWLTFDTEHAPTEVSAVLPLLQAAAPYPVSCLVRPSTLDVALIKRHLDQGAQTVILPYIQTPDEAKLAVAAVRYPPAGIRGVAGGTRASGYGRIPDYAERAGEEICLVLQVETASALSRLDAIADVEGVDALFIGPADLAASMGYPGQTGHPEVRRAVLGALATLSHRGMPAGLLTLDPDFARQAVEAGARFVAVGIDMSLLTGAADRLAAQFRA